MLDVKKIADGLSDAQREALLSDAYPLSPMGPNGHDTFILGFKHGKSAKALHRKGLATLPFAPQILSPLGHAVRKYLEQEQC